MKNLFKISILFITISMNANTIEKNSLGTHNFNLPKIEEPCSPELDNPNLNNENAENDACRVCCTVSISNGLGGLIGVTACSGNIFTSCETAGQDACEKAAKKAISAAFDIN